MVSWISTMFFIKLFFKNLLTCSFLFFQKTYNTDGINPLKNYGKFEKKYKTFHWQHVLVDGIINGIFVGHMTYSPIVLLTDWCQQLVFVWHALSVYNSISDNIIDGMSNKIEITNDKFFWLTVTIRDFIIKSFFKKISV
jgi:hypothetical protein